MKLLLQRIVTSGNKFPDWKGLIGGGLIRGFTEFDMSFLSVSVSLFDCILISFVLETYSEIDGEFVSNPENFTSGIKLLDWKGVKLGVFIIFLLILNLCLF